MSQAWSVRITPKNYTLDQCVSDLSGTACVIVKHTWSYKTRKDTAQHIHIYWMVSKVITKETFNDTIVKRKFPKLDGRHAEYCTTETESLESYLDYALRDKNKYKKKGSELLYWNIPSPKPDWIDTLVLDPIYDEVPVDKISVVASSPLDAYRGRGIVNVKKNTTEDKQEKFFKYVMEYVALKPTKDLTTKKVAKLLYEYSKGGFRPEIAPMYINYAMRNYLLTQGESTPRYKDYRTHWIRQVMDRKIPDF